MAAAKADSGFVPQVTLETLDEGGLSAQPTEPDTPRTAMRKIKKPPKKTGGVTPRRASVMAVATDIDGPASQCAQGSTVRTTENPAPQRASAMTVRNAADTLDELGQVPSAQAPKPSLPSTSPKEFRQIDALASDEKNMLCDDV